MRAHGTGVFKSTDGGGNWRAVNTGLLTPVRVPAIDPVTPAILYVGTWEAACSRARMAATQWSTASTGLVLQYPL